MRRLLPAALLIVFALFSTVSAHAQTETGAICVQTFADANKNMIREEGEASLSGVSANLKQDGILFSNLILDDKTTTETCFRNLTPGDYAITFVTPFADATTATQFAFNVKAKDQLQAQFGAAPHPVTPVATGLIIPLTRPVRLGMSIGGALIVMLFMTGLGLILRNFFGIIRGGSTRRGVQAV